MIPSTIKRTWNQKLTIPLWSWRTGCHMLPPCHCVALVGPCARHSSARGWRQTLLGLRLQTCLDHCVMDERILLGLWYIKWWWLSMTYFNVACWLILLEGIWTYPWFGLVSPSFATHTYILSSSRQLMFLPFLANVPFWSKRRLCLTTNVFAILPKTLNTHFSIGDFTLPKGSHFTELWKSFFWIGTSLLSGSFSYVKNQDGIILLLLFPPLPIIESWLSLHCWTAVATSKLLSHLFLQRGRLLAPCHAHRAKGLPRTPET